jgi:hypothetical protein
MAETLSLGSGGTLTASCGAKQREWHALFRVLVGAHWSEANQEERTTILAEVKNRSLQTKKLLEEAEFQRIVELVMG